MILRDDGLYGFSGQIDEGHLSKKFDPLTGEVWAEFKTGRRACTRPTGAVDAIFYRASGGSTRFDIAAGRAQLVSPMRAQCHDGVTIANGLLYWWPSVCDCNLTLYGITCLGPAGDFDFGHQATEEKHRKEGVGNHNKVAPLPMSPADWPTFRADNLGSGVSKAGVNQKGKQLWEVEAKTGLAPTAPVAAGGLVFLGGGNGIVRALEAQTGKMQWKFYTGGAVRISPTIWNNRALVGSGDGWIYALEAKTGRLLWRFRAAPRERKICVYGALLSTWPVGSGVLVEDGVAYAAAGIVNYDGTHVYALDAITGNIKWQNHTSGHLDSESRSGVSVQGHMLLYGDKLYLAGGNAVSPGIYDIKSGRCENDPQTLKRFVQNNLRTAQSPRGWELYRIGEDVTACGRPFYAHPQYKVYDDTVFQKTHVASVGNCDIVWINNTRVICFNQVKDPERFHKAWGKLDVPGLEPLWQHDCPESRAVALCPNAVVIAGADQLQVLNLADGAVLWSAPLAAKPVEWGLAVSAQGKIILTLENGHVICFG